MESPVRTFISIRVPKSDALAKLVGELSDIDGIRVPPAEQMHLTVKFIGDTDPKVLPRLLERLTAELSNIRSFDLRAVGVGAFPNIRDPRIVWVGFDHGDELRSISDASAKVLDSMHIGYDAKRFSPHMTVGRVGRRVDIGDIAERYADAEFLSFRCDRVYLMKSTLNPGGAKHSVIGSIDLKD